MSLDIIRAEVSARIGQGYRLTHTLGVEEECIALAALFSLSERETFALRTAALLHDLTKHLSFDKQRALFHEFSLPFGEIEQRSGKTLHAVTGAHLSRRLFPEQVDETVFSCILTHTTGAPRMTLPQKLLYLADFIEPNRTFPSCIALRSAFWTLPEDGNLIKHLNHILLDSFDQTLLELVEAHAYIHPTTLEARNDLLAHLKGV